MKTILLIGSAGQLGWELERALAPLGRVVAADRQRFDLLYPGRQLALLRSVNPDIIVNAAAYTAVDKAESEREAAMAVNGDAPAILAEEAKRLNAIFIHYSSDYVFDGNSKKPYSESDAPNPKNWYGESKYRGEKNVEAVGGSYIILRTSWVFGLRRNNFLLTMLKRAKAGEELPLIADQIGTPTWSRLIAVATSQLIAKLCLRELFQGELWGVYHLTSQGQTSRFHFAEEIFALNSALLQGESPKLLPITSSQLGAAAKRPAYSALSCDKLLRLFGIQLPSWERSLELCMRDIGQSLGRGVL